MKMPKRAIAVMKIMWERKDSELLRLYGYKLASNEMIAHSSTDEKFLSIARWENDIIKERAYIDRHGREHKNRTGNLTTIKGILECLRRTKQKGI